MLFARVTPHLTTPHPTPPPPSSLSQQEVLLPLPPPCLSRSLTTHPSPPSTFFLSLKKTTNHNIKKKRISLLSLLPGEHTGRQKSQTRQQAAIGDRRPPPPSSADFNSELHLASTRPLSSLNLEQIRQSSSRRLSSAVFEFAFYLFAVVYSECVCVEAAPCVSFRPPQNSPTAVKTE